MILPERVLGSASVKRMSSGLARAPISWRRARAEFLSARRCRCTAFEGDEGGDGLAFDFIGTADDGGFGDRAMRDEGRFDLRRCRGDGR